MIHIFDPGIINTEENVRGGFGKMLVIGNKMPFKKSGNRATLFNMVGQPLHFQDLPLVSFAARYLIRGLLMKEPRNRLAYKCGATEIRQFPFFEGVNWALIFCVSPPEVQRPEDAWRRICEKILCFIKDRELNLQPELSEYMRNSKKLDVEKELELKKIEVGGLVTKMESLEKEKANLSGQLVLLAFVMGKQDVEGYDLVLVDAMYKANYACQSCHSCRPNCEAKFTGADGKRAFQKVLKEHHGLLDRHQLLLEVCELNLISEKDYIELGKAGLGSFLLGGLSDWFVAYSSHLVRFKNSGRTANWKQWLHYLAIVGILLENTSFNMQGNAIDSTEISSTPVEFGKGSKSLDIELLDLFCTGLKLDLDDLEEVEEYQPIQDIAGKILLLSNNFVGSRFLLQMMQVPLLTKESSGSEDDKNENPGARTDPKFDAQACGDALITLINEDQAKKAPELLVSME